MNRETTMTRAKGAASSRATAEGAERTCVGCGARAPEHDLVRLVLVPGATVGGERGERPPADGVVPDAKGGTFGRGAHVHPSQTCLANACRKGLARAFKREVRADVAQLSKAIGEAYGRRVEGLLSGGTRAGLVAIGTDAVAESVASGAAELVVLAADATAAAQRSAVQKMTGLGKTLVFADKARLARALGRPVTEQRDGVAVCSVTNLALATSVRRAWLCAVGLSSTGTRAAPDGETATVTESELGAGAHVGTGKRSPSEAEA
jgi:predicted RNA-binding protein YlxR (DUF448 family)/ribosomal protein L7Ae-like RNA K-turn-binding protein